MGVFRFLFLMDMAGLEKLLLTYSTEALWSPSLWRDAQGWELKSFSLSFLRLYPMAGERQKDFSWALLRALDGSAEAELSNPICHSCYGKLLCAGCFSQPCICYVQTKLVFMLRKMSWNVINPSKNCVCSCRTTVTVQNHYKSVPICTLTKGFIRIFST